MKRYKLLIILVPVIVILFYVLAVKSKFLQDYLGQPGDFVSLLTALFTFVYVILTVDMVRATITNSKESFEQVKVARHAFVRQMENDIHSLFAEHLAQSKNGDKWEDREFRNVLEQHPKWEVYKQEDMIDSINEKGQRFWVIRSNIVYKGQNMEQRLSSKAFHETLLWFRRLKKAYDDHLVTDEDLCDLWHQILPFGYGGRIPVFSEYFREDIGQMIFIINHTIKACIEKDRLPPLEDFFETIAVNDDDTSHFDKKIYNKAKSRYEKHATHKRLVNGLNPVIGTKES